MPLSIVSCYWERQCYKTKVFTMEMKNEREMKENRKTDNKTDSSWLFYSFIHGFIYVYRTESIFQELMVPMKSGK